MSDCFIVNEVVDNDVYQLKRWNVRPRTVLDVGAHIGVFAVLSQQLWAPEKIVCIEPCQSNVPVLLANVESFATVIHAGMWHSTGDVTFHERDKTYTGSLELDDSGIPVHTVTLRDVLDEHFDGQVDLAKFDCEGCEAVLCTDDAAVRGIKHIRMEWHCRGAMKAIREKLESLGFAVAIPVDNGEIGLLFAERT